jgi:hypothetical protein
MDFQKAEAAQAVAGTLFCFKLERINFVNTGGEN